MPQPRGQALIRHWSERFHRDRLAAETVLALRDQADAIWRHAFDLLQRCAEAPLTAQAIEQSRWCSGCAGGSYVTGLISKVTAAYVAQYGPPPAATAERPNPRPAMLPNSFVILVFGK